MFSETGEDTAELYFTNQDSQLDKSWLDCLNCTKLLFGHSGVLNWLGDFVPLKGGCDEMEGKCFALLSGQESAGNGTFLSEKSTVLTQH